MEFKENAGPLLSQVASGDQAANGLVQLYPLAVRCDVGFFDFVFFANANTMVLRIAATIIGFPPAMPSPTMDSRLLHSQLLDHGRALRRAQPPSTSAPKNDINRIPSAPPTPWTAKTSKVVHVDFLLDKPDAPVTDEYLPPQQSRKTVHLLARRNQRRGDRGLTGLHASYYADKAGLAD